MVFVHTRRRGFTLIELLVVVAVAGILAAVAYPAYTGFLQRGRRAEAVKVLTLIVQAQERYRSNRNTYATSVGSDDGGLGIVSPITEHYDFDLSGVGDPPSFASGYTVTATPKSSSSQTGDATCATLGVTVQGANFIQFARDSSSHDTKSQCWPK